MSDTEVDDLPHYAKRLLDKVRSNNYTVIRTSSDTDEAMTKGGGYLYSAHPGGRKLSPASCRLLIETGVLAPAGDGLLAEVSQTFRVAANG